MKIANYLHELLQQQHTDYINLSVIWRQIMQRVILGKIRDLGT